MIPRCLDVAPLIPMSCQLHRSGARGGFVLRVALLAPSDILNQGAIFSVARMQTTYSTN